MQAAREDSPKGRRKENGNVDWLLSGLLYPLGHMKTFGHL